MPRPSLLVALVLACTPPPPGGDATQASGDPGASTTDATADAAAAAAATTALATTGTGATTGADTSMATHEDSTFVAPTDLPPPGFYCDWFAQDCPSGEKCVPLDQGVVSYLGGPVCVPLSPEPVRLGGSCTLLGDPWIDDCEPGTVCLEVTAEGFGTCRQICLVNFEQDCTMPDTLCLGPFCQSCTVQFCQPACDALDPLACPEGQQCALGGICVFDASGDEGQDGDECEWPNACDPAMGCVYGPALADCAARNCCSPLCDLDEPNPCAELGETCVPYDVYPYIPPPLNEDVGVCAVPDP